LALQLFPVVRHRGRYVGVDTRDWLSVTEACQSDRVVFIR
jgi:hypothetical protein